MGWGMRGPRGTHGGWQVYAYRLSAMSGSENEQQTVRTSSHEAQASTLSDFHLSHWQGRKYTLCRIKNSRELTSLLYLQIYKYNNIVDYH